MLQFLVGVALGAGGYWAWQSFGRDLMGMGSDQGESTYGGFSSSSGSSTGTTYGSGTSSGTTGATSSQGTGGSSGSAAGGSTTGSSA